MAYGVEPITVGPAARACTFAAALDNDVCVAAATQCNSAAVAAADERGTITSPPAFDAVTVAPAPSWSTDALQPPQVSQPQFSHPQFSHPQAQAPFSGSSTVVHPPPASSGGAGVGTAVLGLIGGFVSLVVIGVLALTFLGGTAEPSFEEIALPEQPAQATPPIEPLESAPTSTVPEAAATVDVVPETATPVEDTTSELAGPAASVTTEFTSATGNFTLEGVETWNGPEVDVHLAADSHFSTIETDTYPDSDPVAIVAWSDESAGRVRTHASIIGEIAELEGLTVRQLGSITDSGETVGVGLMSTPDGSDTPYSGYAAGHRTDDGYAVLIIWGSTIEVAMFADVAYSIRYVG